LKRKKNIRSRPHAAVSIAAEALAHALLDFFTAALQQRALALPLSSGETARGATLPRPEDLEPVRTFLAACTEQTFGCRVQSAKLHMAYSQWARAAGQPSLTNKMLSMRLNALGFRSLRSRCIFWVDMRLIKSAE
jgi:hypothetical protein